MIRVEVVKSSKTGSIKSIELKGHALFDEYGKDIVCAAVSILSLNTFNSIESFCEDRFESYESPEKGILRIRFEKPLSDEAALLMKSLLLGLNGISEEYGNEFVTIKTRQEV